MIKLFFKYQVYIPSKILVLINRNLNHDLTQNYGCLYRNPERLSASPALKMYVWVKGFRMRLGFTQDCGGILANNFPFFGSFRSIRACQCYEGNLDYCFTFMINIQIC